MTMTSDANRALSSTIRSLRQRLLDAGALCDAPQPSPSTICRKLVKTVDKNDLILVFGSFYTVADVIQYSGLMHSDKD